MVREKFNELLDFATTESPYKSANKGWINNDVFLQWGRSKDSAVKAGTELADVSVYWTPINQILSILFFVLAVGATFVFAAILFSKGQFDISNKISFKTYEPTLEVKQIQLKEQSLEPSVVVDELDSNTQKIDVEELIPTEVIKVEPSIQMPKKVDSALGGSKIDSTQQEQKKLEPSNSKQLRKVGIGSGSGINLLQSKRL